MAKIKVKVEKPRVFHEKEREVGDELMMDEGYFEVAGYRWASKLEEQPGYICDVCGYEAKTLRALKIHMTKAHGNKEEKGYEDKEMK